MCQESSVEAVGIDSHDLTAGLANVTSTSFYVPVRPTSIPLNERNSKEFVGIFNVPYLEYMHIHIYSHTHIFNH